MSSHVTRFFLVSSLIGVLASTAQASAISAIYAFGDSLSDAGNVYAATSGVEPGAPYSNGRFTNGNLWVQDLASNLGLPAVTASLLGGTDFAVGGAQSGTTPVHVGGAGDLQGNPFSQIAAFQALNPTGANPNGLYTIWIGGDDIRALLTSSNPTATAPAEIAAVVKNIDNAITTLAGDGAKNFLVITVPDLGKIPESIAAGPLAVAAASTLSFDLNIALEASLGSIETGDPLLNLKVVDTYSLIDGIVADPSKFGLADVTDPCLTGAVNYSGGTACANPSQYLFWDQIHPTAAGHTIVADAALATIVPEPATLTMLGVGVLSLFAIRRRLSAA